MEGMNIMLNVHRSEVRRDENITVQWSLTTFKLKKVAFISHRKKCLYPHDRTLESMSLLDDKRFIEQLIYVKIITHTTLWTRRSVC